MLVDHPDALGDRGLRRVEANPRGFRGARDVTFSVKNNGVGYGKLSSRLSRADRAYITKKANAIKKLIAQGKIKPPAK